MYDSGNFRSHAPLTWWMPSVVSCAGLSQFCIENNGAIVNQMSFCSMATSIEELAEGTTKLLPGDDVTKRENQGPPKLFGVD